MLIPSRRTRPEPSDGALRFTGAVCTLCRQVRQEEDLDQDRLCPDCRGDVLRKLRTLPHFVALAILVAVFVVASMRVNFEVLPWYLWAVQFAAVYYLGVRLGRETIKGYIRWKRSR